MTASATRVRADGRQLSVRIGEQIEAFISAGKLAPGQRINEAALAGELHVSRSPVREALRGLEARRLVTMIPNRGMFVRELTVKEMLDIFDMRAVLMGYGAMRATELLNRERKQQLATLLTQMDKATKADDGERYYRVNFEFHKTILEFSNNERALIIYEQLANDLHRFRRRYFSFAPNMIKSNAEHRAMFDAMVRGESVEARRLAEQHVQQGKLRVLDTI